MLLFAYILKSDIMSCIKILKIREIGISNFQFWDFNILGIDGECIRWNIPIWELTDPFNPSTDQWCRQDLNVYIWMLKYLESWKFYRFVPV